MNDIITSFIRTIVPTLVAILADLFARFGLNIDNTSLGGLEAFLVALLTGVYYLIVRLLETYVSPHFGWLLGYAKKPNYTNATPQATALPSAELSK